MGGPELQRIDLQSLGFTVDAECTVPNGGGTKKEVPENLIDSGTENWNKWYCHNQNNSWIEIASTNSKIRLDGIAFKSANDEPTRDPVTATVKYVPYEQTEQNETKEWELIDTYDLDFEAERHKRIEIKFASCQQAWSQETYEVLIELTNPEGDSLQLAEIELLTDI